MSAVDDLLKLIKENPNLPVVPMVDSEIVADDYCSWWLAKFGDSEVAEYYVGEEHVHLKNEDTWEILEDAKPCDYKGSLYGVGIECLSDEELAEAFNSLPWVKAIMVHVTV